jgi:hypothetical protein
MADIRITVLAENTVYQRGLRGAPGPAHCTGWQATRQLWTAFGNRCFVCGVGTQVSF